MYRFCRGDKQGYNLGRESLPSLLPSFLFDLPLFLPRLLSFVHSRRSPSMSVLMCRRPLPPPSQRARVPAPCVLRDLRACPSSAAVRLRHLRRQFRRGRSVRRQRRDRAGREAPAVPEVL